MKIYLERIYDEPQHKGYRVLADRVWPRGVTKERALLDEWCKDVTPSTELRQWFGHDPEKWFEFSKLYQKELQDRREDVRALLARVGKAPLVLLSGTKDVEHTHTIVLKDYLSRLS